MKTIDGQQKRYEDRFFDKDFEKASHREGVVQKELHRGDVFFYLKPDAVGGEIQTKGGRPCVIVSNERQNLSSYNCVTICPITSEVKTQSVNVPVHGKVVHGTILCQQITTVTRDRLTSFVEELNETVMDKVDEALREHLQLPPFATKKELKAAANSQPEPAQEEVQEQSTTQQDDGYAAQLEKDLVEAKTERDLYKKLYDALLDKVVNK